MAGLATGGAVIAACSPQAAPEPTATPAPAEGGEGAPADTRPMEGNMYLEGFPLVREKETLTFFAPHNTAVEDYNTNHFVTTYEEMTNVHIDWQLVPPSGLNEKKNLAFASGDLPDCFFGAGVGKSEAVMYGGQGLLTPIEDLIEQYNPEVQKVFTETPEGELGKKLLTAPDGHIYQYPNYTFCYHCTYPYKFWINQKWLDNVGMEIPTTTDELYEVLVAFRDQDANGNGDAGDEIPFSGSTGWSSWPNNWLMNAFILDDHYNHFYILDGTLHISANKPEYKEGLKYLAKLYSEGLMDPEAFTQDVDMLRQKIQNPDFALAGSSAHMHYLGLAGADTGDPNERPDEYVAPPPLVGPNGAQYCNYNPYIVSGGKYVITSACEHPELAARWIDWFYTEEGLLLQKYGREGIEWYHPSPDSGEMGHGEGLGPIPARFNWMPGKGWTETLQNITLNQQGPIYETREFRGAWTSTEESPLEPRLVAATDKYVGHEMEEIWPNPMMTLEETEELRQIGTQINDYIGEMVARFVTGELDIDAEWDSYVSALNEMGLERYLEINQIAYDRFLVS
jgi:putative aldouronate transport system substrate-binding protein